jgi:phenylalanyl-tRNA synthetase beta chain
MQFPESWLREFCDPALSSQALADLLTLSGMEVEELRPVAPAFSGVVVAEIVEAAAHPSADRLRVCKVRTSAAAEPLQIVCGAPNARVGIRVPLATVGAVLPAAANGQALNIGLSNLRGVDSAGMLCSARELGIADDHAGLLELSGDAALGANVRDVLKLDDMLFTLKLTPNLAHVLSVYGIAREVSALTGTPLKVPTFTAAPVSHAQTLPVQVLAADLCGRFSGRVIRNVNTQAKTPGWIVERLARCGQRSVSALVDISNYVMFEYGRPSHIFDLDKIHEKLIVRWGQAGEQLELLNGSTVTLDDQVGVIADVKAVESLAGIMGGQATAVSDSTTNVYVEAAFWWPDAVAGRSRRFGFATDAGHRFERGVDPALTVEHIEHITALILQICGGQAGPMDDQVLALPQNKPVTMRVERAAKIIGMPLTQAACADVFRRLGLGFSEKPGALEVVPPSWRFDLRIEEDLIEEVIRVIGFDKLPDVAPRAPVAAVMQAEGRRSARALRHALAGRDYQEVLTYSFVEERWERELAGNTDPVRVLNPIAAPLAVMRSSLIGSLVEAMRHNLARRASRVRLFEVGRVFLRDAAAPDGPVAVAGVSQPMRLAGLAFGSAAATHWAGAEREVDFFDVKGDIAALLGPRQAVFVAGEHPAMHPGRCARVEVDGVAIGYLGQLHPRWRQAYELPKAPMLFELNLEALLALPVPTFQPLARQLSVHRDLALVVQDGVQHDELMACLTADDDGLVQGAHLFDVYKPTQPGSGLAEGERSMAVRLELLDPDATLTDERIAAALAAAVQRAQARLGARLRA